MTEITPIPLRKLVVSEDNVRRTAATDAGLQELAASIGAHGLLQSLVVRKHQKGKFAVVAGGRRLAALQLLAEQGRIAATFAVPCQVRNGDDAAELSLAETCCASRFSPAAEYASTKRHLMAQVNELVNIQVRLHWGTETSADVRLSVGPNISRAA